MLYTFKMALRKLISQTKSSTHALVRFTEDQQISIVSMKSIVLVKRLTSQPVSSLSVSAVCTMKWSENKEYEGTILALGDHKSIVEAEKNHVACPEDENTMNTANTLQPKKRCAEATENPPAKRRKKTTNTKKSGSKYQV